MKIPNRIIGNWGATLRAVIDVSERTHSVAYLVGGPVRDLVRGVPLGELDLAIERNEADFARELARTIGAEVIANEAFLTWKLELPGAHTIDLARLRTEVYSRPGALPTVKPASTIEEDLRRRDFSVNAMALRLDEMRLIDPLGGREDLEHGILRILHEESFVDDPTRIFRALRLSTRCGLTLDKRTSNRLDAAAKSGALTTVSRERCWKEIDLACREAHPVPVVRALVERGCLEPFVGVTESTGLANMPDKTVIPRPLDPRIVLIGALARSVAAQLESLPYERSMRASIRAIATREPSLADLLSLEERSDDHFDACESASREERFLAHVERPEITGTLERYERASRAASKIRGNELGVPQGPWIGRAILETRRALFEGTIDESAAPAFARRSAMKYLND